jgi:branched-chain amino acid transport system permease protein
MNDNKSYPSANLENEAEKRRWAAPLSYGILVAILALWPLFYRSAYMMHVLILCFIYMMASVSLRTITVSGQFPLAHAAFMGIGAYLAGMASKWLGWPGWITIPAGALGAMVLGIVIGYPFARLRALYYAMGSLFFGIGVLNFIAAFSKYTGGYSGLMGIHPIFVGSKVPYYYFFLALTLASLLTLYRLEFSRIGTNLKAIAQSHLVASSVGINEGFYRIFAVGVGCFFAGLAGASYAHYNLVISSSSFSFLATLWLVMYVLIGGIESFAGPIVGTIILFLVPEIVRDLKYYSPYVSAGLLIIVVYLVPKGLVSLPQLLWPKRGHSATERKGD